MAGLQLYHPEWKLSVQDIQHVETSPEVAASVDYSSPGLFIEFAGFGKSLVVQRPNEGFDIDDKSLRKHFPHYGHAWYVSGARNRASLFVLQLSLLFKKPIGSVLTTPLDIKSTSA